MGDMGIDKWCLRMEEHKRRGHHIIKYPEIGVKKNVNDVKQGIFLKDTDFWKKRHNIPTTNDLIWWKRER